MPRYDWDYYRHKYVTGEHTLEQLASLPNSPALATLKDRSRTESWKDQRDHYRDQTATKARAAASTTEAEVAARHSKIARALQEKALMRLRDLPIDSLNPKDVLAFLREATTIEREALGLNTTRDSHQNELDAIAEALKNPVPPGSLN